MKLNLQPSIHTIYIAGPSSEPISWLLESSLLYDTIKHESIKNNNTIEIFPKDSYRKSILYSSCRPNKRHVPSVEELEVLYTNTNELAKRLIKLILVRYNEVLDLDEYENEIHLQAYGRGGEVLLKVVRSKYSSFIGSLIVFDSITTDSSSDDTDIRIININIDDSTDSISDTDSTDSTSSTDSTDSTICTDSTESDDTPDEFACNPKTIKWVIGTIGTIVSIVATLIALF